MEKSRLGSGDQIVAGQSVFRVRVDGVPTHVGEVLSPTGSRIDLAALASDGLPITCAGCGMLAPPDLDVASDSGEEMAGAILWWCALCRAQVAATPQPVPDYTTLRELGHGSMGVVYQARHNQTGRMVALKLIIPGLAAARTAIDRFMREMSVMKKLKHPHIVEFLEQGVTRGPMWFAMEYVAGTNLEVLANANKGKYPIPQACRMACQVLRGLEQAHEMGFVHRDIKPENILIGRTPEGLVAKISDFGLAKSYRSSGLGDLTISGEMRGTIPYMPPEQMLEFKTVLPSGDLYATAATLYYLIAGQFIYDQVALAGDLIRSLLEESPVPIQQRRSDVPDGLAAVLMKCLSRDPEARYPSAHALRQVLREFC